MTQLRITDDLDALLGVLPENIVESVHKSNDYDNLLEIILDLGRVPTARYVQGEVILSSKEISHPDLDHVVERIGEFDADNRAGIERTLHRISALRNRRGHIVGLTCRVGRAVYGTVDIIQDIVESGKSLLILGRPGVGKTTLLREAARILAESKRVIIVDTSNEIGGDGDVPHPAVGKARRMQVREPMLQHEVMIEAVENHMPEVIVIDEIGRELEAQAARTIAERGVQLIGTAHGRTLDNLLLNPTLSDLVGGIEAVTLSDEEARRRGTQKTVLERRSPPTFDVLVEIQQRDRFAVHMDISVSVDSLLRGYPLPPEIRSRESDGRIHVEKAKVDTRSRAESDAQALGAKEIVLTRAAKSGGAPTVASRFLQRIAALAGAARWKEACARGANYIAWAEALDKPEGKPQPMARPEPSPPLDVRPDKLSVTDIENWLRDPYTIYAKHVLRLFPLEAVDTPPGAADRGTFIHEAVGEFTKKFADTLPAYVAHELTALGKKHFAQLEDYEEARAFWWTRFLRIADWFGGWERERRAAAKKIFAEISGKNTIPLGKGDFLLTARADRIEQRADGSYAILDYKTGKPPTDLQVRSGLAPQLTLETAILRKGGFSGVAAGSVSEIGYVRLKGGDPPGEPRSVKFTEGTPDTYADIALRKLTEIANKFIVEGEPYRSLVHPMWKKHYGEYDHLARVKEWAASGGESESEFES